MKSFFDKKRTEMHGAYGRHLKRIYPWCRFNNQCVNMRVFFPREPRYSSLDLHAVFENREYFAWPVRSMGRTSKFYEYEVSIFPRGTQVYKLNWIGGDRLPATERQVETLSDLLILHQAYRDYPWQAPLGRLLSRRRASDIITALLENRHVALVLDFEWHGTAGEQG